MGLEWEIDGGPTPHFGAALAALASALVLSFPFETALANHTALPMVLLPTPTSAKGRVYVFDWLAQLRSVTGIATAMAQLAIDTGIDAGH